MLEYENKVVFKYINSETDEELYFSLKLKHSDFDFLDKKAFLSFCDQINVPGEFALRNPEDVNFSIFEYWVKNTKSGVVELSYNNKSESLVIVDEEEDDLIIEAYPIIGFE